MSNHNEANELASELVFGKTYQGDEPTQRPERLVFVNANSTAIIWREEESHDEWAAVANAIDRLLNEGYVLGCDMDISWNGRYDADGDPLPGGPSYYLPCRVPATAHPDGRHLCQKHDYAGHTAKWTAEQQSGAGGVEEL